MINAPIQNISTITYGMEMAWLHKKKLIKGSLQIRGWIGDGVYTSFHMPYNLWPRVLSTFTHSITVPNNDIDVNNNSKWLRNNKKQRRDKTSSIDNIFPLRCNIIYDNMTIMSHVYGWCNEWFSVVSFRLCNYNKIHSKLAFLYLKI